MLLAAGVAMLATYVGARAHGEAGRAEALAAFDAAPAPSIAPVPVAQPVPEAAAPERGARSEALAVLRIPAVELEVPVFDGIGERALNRGAGHITGTPRPGAGGNVGLASHRDGWFRALEHVSLGDEIELATRTGLVRYRVTDLTVVDPTDVSVLDPTDEPVLTLVTCYPFYFVGSAPQRYIVRAVAIN